MALRARRSALQAKLELTEGLDPGSWATGDVLALTAISEALNPETQQLNEFGGSLDSGETIVGAFKPVLTARGAFRGSGAPGVPIPPFSALMQAAGFKETLHTTTIPAAAATAATSGTANTITFDASTGGWPTTAGTSTIDQATSVIGEVIEITGANLAVSPTWATCIGYNVAVPTATVMTLSRNATDCGIVGGVFTTAN